MKTWHVWTRRFSLAVEENESMNFAGTIMKLETMPSGVPRPGETKATCSLSYVNPSFGFLKLCV